MTRAEQESTTRLQSGFLLSAFVLVHLSKVCPRQSPWGQKVPAVTWGGSQLLEQLGFAVSSGEGWINLGSVVFSVTVLGSSCKIGEFER